MSAMEQIMAHARQTQALAQVLGRLGWDQETVMPRGAAAQRAEEIAALETVLHARRTDPRLAAWLESAVPATPAEAANLRLIRRAHERASKVPADLAAEIARVTSLAQGIWAGARAGEDVAAFLPTLAQVIALRREEAAALAGDRAPYDALIQDYEPGASAESLGRMFAALRPRLVALRDAVLGRPAPQLAGSFAADRQMELSRRVARAFGYDLDCGRIDIAVHPFSSGSGRDVRITTRIDPADPLGCVYSTIHEVGHAGYEQGIAAEHLLTPVGEGASMGVHESQSRIYENQLGRSRGFTDWLFGQMRELFGEIGVSTPEEFYRAVNRVAPGHIRTEADEVQYNLHVLLRFDLERALIAGDLAVGDLEAAWNDRFAADFGMAVDRPSNGMLQDVHWSVGLFGYFPTYTLGNVYAGGLFAALTQAVPDWEGALARGDAGPAVAWLRGALQVHGGMSEPRALIEQASGAPVSEAPLLAYLETKFRDLYA